MVRVGVRARIRVNLTLTLTKSLKLNPNLLSYWECCQNMVRKKNCVPLCFSPVTTSVLFSGFGFRQDVKSSQVTSQVNIAYNGPQFLDAQAELEQ